MTKSIFSEPLPWDRPTVTKSIFSEPNAHDVQYIDARVSEGNQVVCLSLYLSGKSPFVGARAGQVDIYGPLAMVDKFKTLANAIHAIFTSGYQEVPEAFPKPPDARLPALLDERGFLRDLASRMLDIPASYGVDQGDIDHLLAIGTLMMKIEEGEP